MTATLWDIVCLNILPSYETCFAIKDNLRDKLRAVPIEVNVEIMKPSGRRKRQNALAELTPILSKSPPSLTEVHAIYKSAHHCHTLKSFI